MKVLKILAIVVAINICIMISFVSWLLIDTYKEDEYWKSSNWDCETKVEFLEKYKPFYIESIDDLLKKYDITVEKVIEEDKVNGQLDLYYYNDENTIHFMFFPDVGLAHFDATYFRYEVNGVNLSNYEEQRNYVDFFNEVIELCAFDARGDENTFKNLFDKALVEGGYDSYYYHYDSVSGNNGYSAGVNRNNRYDAYYYKMEKNYRLDLMSNKYIFEGILKPQFIG